MTFTKGHVHTSEDLNHFIKNTGQKAHNPGKISSLNQILLPLVDSSTLFKPFQMKTIENIVPIKQ